ncbi:MAG: MFS transporter [Thermomicrobiales bacterium]
MRTKRPLTSPPSQKGSPSVDDAGSDTDPDLLADAIAPGEDEGRDAAGSAIGRGEKKINWRRNLYAIWAAQLLAIMAFSMRAPFLPFFLGDLGIPTDKEQALWAGFLNAGGAGVMAIAAPIWGSMADRKGRRPMLLRAQFCSFVTIGLMGIATSPWHVLGLRMVEGALAGTVTAATALVATTIPKERLGFGLGLIQTAIFSGAAIGPLVGGILADQIGYRETFGVASAMMFCGGTITLFLVHENFHPVVREEGAPVQERAWHMLLTPLLLGMTIAMIGIRAAEGAIQPIMSLFIKQLSGNASNASTLAGLSLGVLGMTSAISAIILGRVGDKRGYRKILMICALGAALIYLPMSLTQHPWQMIVLQGIFGIFAGGMIPSANALVAKGTDPERRGLIFGMMATATSIGGFIGPLAGSGFAASFGFRATFLLTGALVLAVVVVLVVTGKRTPHESTFPSASAD